MTAGSLSYEGTLRAIGESLERLRVLCFELEWNGKDYRVHMTDSETARQLDLGTKLLKRIAQTVGDRPIPMKSARNLYVYLSQIRLMNAG